ncbi:hypothetical protein ACYOEI_24940 [Singulisphaera rosea]
MDPTVSRILAGLTLFLLSAESASAQMFIFGGGSTAQGDILRGQGIFLQGAGSFLYNAAVADSINVDTSIRLNEYIWNVAKNENRENAIHRAEKAARQLENYEEILKRIRENPTDNDLEKGDALNDVMTQLLSPQIADSAFRILPVDLPGEMIREIPFFYGPKDATFSMRRLANKGKNAWPVGFRDAAFARERRQYERALDDALDQQLDGKLSHNAILQVELAVKELSLKLDEVNPPSRDKVYLEAKNYLKTLTDAKENFKIHDIEKMLGEIDRYSGTKVHDLMVFMQKYNLRFGVAAIGAEREMYPKLYEKMKQQLDLVSSSGNGGPQR